MVSQIAFGAGSLFLGSALTMSAIFALAGRTGSTNGVEGCYSTFICLSLLLIGIGFFVVGLAAA